MPSTLVHVAFAGLIAVALLGDEFDRRAAVVIFAATALPDLDAFVALFSTAGHRTVGHTLLIPAVAAAVLAVDTRLRADSTVIRRWGPRGVRLAWVSIAALAVAGIGLDLVTGGANPLWPLHDQFYRLSGKIELSNQRGIIQTFIETDPDTGRTGPMDLGSSREVHVSTGIAPDPVGGESSTGGSATNGGTEAPPERVFPIVRSGWQLLVLLTGSAVSAIHLWRVERK